MARFWAKLAQDRRGATAIEYGLIVALIVIVIIASIRGVGDSNSGGWGAVANKVAAVTPSA